MKKRLTLEELELQLPIIQLQETRFLLGGTGYGTSLDNGVISTLPDGVIPATTDNGGGGEEDDDPYNGGTDEQDGDNDGSGDGGSEADDDPYNGGTDEGDPGDEEDNGEGEADNDGYGDDDGSNDGDEGQNEDNYQDGADDYGDNTGNNNGGNNGGYNVSEQSILNSLPESILDGSNLENYIFNLDQGNETFTNQLQTIIESNSVISGFLGYFNNGVVQMIFDVEDIDSPAHTNPNNEEVFHIKFDTDYINSNGFINLNGIDNIGYNHSSLTGVESLVVVLAHEALHAKHHAVWDAAVREVGGNALDARNSLLSQGYSEAFANIFTSAPVYDANGNYSYDLYSGQQLSDNMHGFMQQYDHGVINDALDEFRNDVAELQQHTYNLGIELQDAMDEVDRNWLPEEAQEQAQAQQNLANIEAEWDYIQDNYSWML